MKNILLYCVAIILFSSCLKKDVLVTEKSDYDMIFPDLAQRWDEGIPLGNGVVGSLIWEKEMALRMSLDRVDLWDMRPTDSLSGNNNRFQWIYEQVMKEDYLPVQEKFDHPYDQLPAPSKIPGAGLEFNLNQLGKPTRVQLYLNNALCEISWGNGTKMQTFTHATKPVGWFRIEEVPEGLIPELIPPVYEKEGIIGADDPVTGQDLRRLGYKQGVVLKENNRVSYHQKGWNDFSYDVVVQWEKKGNTMIGVWSVSSILSDDIAVRQVEEALARGIHTDYKTHQNYWNTFWGQSSVCIPDSTLARQYAYEKYKFGSLAREYSYPISLQGVWTADNGKMPPWKGDYHHDLNTQLSYWMCYTGNYLTEGLGYLNTLWEQREMHRQYTQTFFESEGLNVPGVCTLSGEPMGGWVQYAMSPTVGAWLSQHFYLHYKYSGDKVFLKERAYPYIKEVASFFEHFSVVNNQGERTLPLSSSPEVYDNSIKAWFHTITNYDLALIRFALNAASELASDLNLTAESAHWKELEDQFPDYDLEEDGTLTLAKDIPFNKSHRHLSNIMAIHPLGLIDVSHGKEDKRIIDASIANIDRLGTNSWCGYTYSWLGNIKARALDGEGAAKALSDFATCFCSSNSFHLNGDQSGTGKSKLTYRPFTLEGNFAFAAGIQEMLLQSHTGVLAVFPAIPKDWKNVSFDKLRAMGAFLVSAKKENGEVLSVEIVAEKGGLLRIQNPFLSGFEWTGDPKKMTEKNGVLEISTISGDAFVLTKKK